MIGLLTIFNIVFSLFLWVPTWKKILKVKSTEEYSLTSFCMIEALQLSSLALAFLKHTNPFIWYYVANGLTVGTTIFLVWWFQRSKPQIKYDKHNCKEAGCRVG